MVFTLFIYNYTIVCNYEELWVMWAVCKDLAVISWKLYISYSNVMFSKITNNVLPINGIVMWLSLFIAIQLYWYSCLSFLNSFISLCSLGSTAQMVEMSSQEDYFCVISQLYVPFLLPSVSDLIIDNYAYIIHF